MPHNLGFQKREEVLDKFDKRFFDKYYYHDPVFRIVFENLVRGADPYSQIEILVEYRKMAMDKLEEAVNGLPPRLIMFPKSELEQYFTTPTTPSEDSSEEVWDKLGEKDLPKSEKDDL